MVKIIALAVGMIIRSAVSPGAVPGKNDDSTSTGKDSAASVICPLSKKSSNHLKTGRSNLSRERETSIPSSQAEKGDAYAFFALRGSSH
ncbi:MAG: hypothetical protein OXI66_00680 [Boseongicola sp.]|nr:hypothetical protein [Boseongicola sp.]